MNKLAHIVVILSGFVLSFFSLASPATTEDGPLPFDPRNVAWSRLELKAKKLFLTARSTVDLRFVPAAEAAGNWIISPRGRGVVAAGSEVLEIAIESSGFGASTNQVWFNPGQADALQRSKLKPKGYRKDARFLDDGVFVLRSSPIDKSETDGPPEKWSKVQQYFYPHIEGSCSLVTEPSVLLYMVSARRNDGPLQICVFSNKQIIPVLITTTGTEQLEVDYEEISAAVPSRRRTGTVEALRLAVRPLGSNGKVELMGLDGDIEILLDNTSGTPLEVRGDTDVGDVRIKLAAVKLKPQG